MKKLVALMGCIICCLPKINAQTDNPAKDQTDTTEIFVDVESVPEFPGGEQALFQFLGENTQYPQKAMDKGIKGTVYMQFVVMEDGSITKIKALKSPHKLLTEEAARVLSVMPKWKPGMQKGKPVRVYYKLPFRFNLSD